jgi:hypothetical protein
VEDELLGDWIERRHGGLRSFLLFLSIQKLQSPPEECKPFFLLGWLPGGAGRAGAGPQRRDARHSNRSEKEAALEPVLRTAGEVNIIDVGGRMTLGSRETDATGEKVRDLFTAARRRSC